MIYRLLDEESELRDFSELVRLIGCWNIGINVQLGDELEVPDDLFLVRSSYAHP